MSSARLLPGMRVLKVRRISRDTEDSSALLRQGEELDRATEEARFTVAGEVEDVCVSGAVNLDDRPKLGRWMKDPLWHEWDAIMVTSLDRITRDQHHWDRFAERCHKGGKEIVCLDDPSLDIHTPTGRMIAYIKATQAQEYREAIVRKRRNQTQYYRDASLWGGGTWPFGYRPVMVDHHGKQRFKLVIDPVTGPLVREAYERIAEQGWSMGQLCTDWNSRPRHVADCVDQGSETPQCDCPRGVLTSQDYQRSINAQENKAGVKTHIKGTKWSTSTLGKILKKPTLKGVAMHKGEPLLRDGLPVRWADPILTDDEFDKLQIAVTELGKYRAGIKSNASPMTGVLYCPCGMKMYENSSLVKLSTGNTKKHKYFRCASWSNGDACQFSTSWPQVEIYQAVEESFLSKLGAEYITERSYVPGKDNRQQIKELEAAMENLSQAIAQASSAAAVTALTATLERHATNLATLQEEPFVPGRWEETSTGQTYRAKWQQMADWKERGPFLRKAGFRIFLVGSPKVGLSIGLITPKDLQERASGALQGNWASSEGEEYERGAYAAFLSLLSEQLHQLTDLEELKQEKYRDDFDPEP
ncbi:recombinase family protein [Streptomyces sp. NPDC088810]|uniref:recombinase family protein n=1 Tax=Streptomyces sp. NPDC088810 TaxID=3365904 RepID=UPI003824B4FB